MKRTFIEYNAYLSYLFKLPENSGKKESEIARKYHLMENSFTINKCGLNARRKRKLPHNTYAVRPLLSLKGSSLSEDAYNDNIIIEVPISNIKDIIVPFSAIYELESLDNSNLYFKRSIDNIYLMEKLSNTELTELDKNSLSYYQNMANGTRYAQEINEDGSISLTVLHDENTTIKEYYACDEYYPESLKDIISYLEVNTKETFTSCALPKRKSNSILKRILEPKNKK